jgi:DNA invertase Pin-like site-specific DNA recombinase
VKSGVPFVATDRIGADAFQLHIEAAVAEREARAVSERTRAALAARRARGLPLGAENPACRNLTTEGSTKGAERSRAVRGARAIEADQRLAPIARELASEGLSLRAIAAKLAERGVLTSKGKPLPASRVQRILGHVE